MSEDLGPLVSNWMSVDGLQRLVSTAPMQLRTFCMAIEDVLSCRSWVRFYNPHLGIMSTYEDTQEGFIRFVTTKYTEGGLGSTVEELSHLVKDYPSARKLLEDTLARGQGGANNPTGVNQHTKKPDREETEGDMVNHDIIMVDHMKGPQHRSKQGTSVGYAIRRLSRERPDLLDKVGTGELSANAAMIQAGFRRVPTSLDLLRKAWKKATPAEKDQFMTEVNEEGW